jgi:hypothetical protein
MVIFYLKLWKNPKIPQKKELASKALPPNLYPLFMLNSEVWDDRVL